MDPKFARGQKYDDLVKYTDNLCDENLIGSFPYFRLYRSRIHSWGEYYPLVVKIWNTSKSEIRDNELRFMREVIFLRHEKVKKHPALVPLFGYVNDGKRLGIIYEFKAVDTVFNQLCEDDFTWLRRIKVILWLARLLRIFHRKNPPYGPFLIRNIDASHILLDEEYFPRLFDFSFMTGGGIFPNKPRCAVTLSSELTGEWATHDEVFAFGLLLLNLISKRDISKEEAAESTVASGCSWSLSEWKSVSSLQGNKKVRLSLVHGSFEVEPQFYAPDGPEISSLAIQCLHSSPKERPSMKQVVRCLKKLKIVQNHGDLLAFKPKPVRLY